uniref:NADH-ubiquinone oxidoreductase chain 5 n=1 Tax=Aulacus sinensis TaxID=2491146 RepID=A0A3S8V0B3_9HYME|nr:NADH dehydrogenase subunit 5 [Aulacus sinensis]
MEFKVFIFLMSLLLILMSIFMMNFSIIMFNYNKMFYLSWLFNYENSIEFSYYLFFDWMSLIFLSVVMMITSMVFLYSMIYMKEEKKKYQFMYLILMFMISMVLMIMSPNLLSILLGWDGLGLVSYCLIIYYQNFSSFQAGYLTILLNRVGDIMLIIMISFMMIIGKFNFINLKYIFFNKNVIILIIIAGMTKSAQVPFSSWLPAAMAAPTPVSSLVHSSTLVTAGIYLIIRFNKLLKMSSIFLMILMFISLLTMLLAGFSANFEYDLKKIIALSTLSQLGLMMMILSIGSEMLSFFHLLSHALFKSLLFLCSGYFIHYMNNNQDIRFYGSMKFMSPMIMLNFNVSSLSLCGFFFLSGFFSKDLILEYFLFKFNNVFILYLIYLSIGLTIMYSFRLFYYFTFKINKMNSMFLKYNEELQINYSLIILLVSSIFGGYFMKMNYFYNSSEILVISMYLKFLILYMIFLSLLISYWMYLMNLNLLNYIKLFKFMIFFLSLWYLKKNLLKLINPTINVSKFIYYNIEKGWNEYMGYLSFLELIKMFMNFNNLYMFKKFIIMIGLLVMFTQLFMFM